MQRNRHGTDQRYALIGRAGQYIKSNTGLHDRVGVTDPPGFKGKFTKSQNTGINGKLDKLTLVIKHGISPVNALRPDQNGNSAV